MRPRVAIIGAGMSGIAMAAKLLQAGVADVRIFEKAQDYGGTWRDNTYPGLACDVPSPFYSYSFAPNPDWTHRFSAGPEIHRYLCDVAERHGLREHTVFGTEIARCDWDGARWTMETTTGATHVADVVVAATGVLHRPRLPELPGLETFAGPAFHSARWDHDVPLEGARIGVLGTGSTGVQIVTALGEAGHQVTQFQRTPQWTLPMGNAEYSRSTQRALRQWPQLSRLLYRYHQRMLESTFEGLIKPGVKRWVVQTACRLNLWRVRDPELRARLTPKDEPMCRRLIMSAGYYKAVQLPNVEIVSGGIARVEPTGLVTEDGRLHEIDVLVMATGFDAQSYLRPMAVTGEDGVTLDEVWRDGPRAHRTIGMPGFPNLFLLLGPNSPIGNTSLFPIAEAQVAFVLRLVRRIAAGEATAYAPTPEASAKFTHDIREAMPDTVWVTGCDSWYLAPDGTPTLWPFTPQAFYDMLAAGPGDDFASIPAPAADTAATQASSL
ncbi:MAG: NAD(P)/FAD-dependent oxidoreductase [Solirubrobacteraceae bacterium]|nr:NAD(P)/FAD-dependent oxidoreductase [Solirubrobacteraceae bacterium]